MIIFGTGDYYQRYKLGFRNMEIIGFIDNNAEKWDSVIDGYRVYSPDSIRNLKYDYVFLVSIHYKEMRKQLMDLGVSEDKIIDEEHLLFLNNLVVAENYTFSKNAQEKGEAKKKVLLISHVLNLTGAPVVFCRLAHILKQNGYEVTVYAEKRGNLQHGNLLYQLIMDGISVTLFNDLRMISVESIDKQYDVFWVNTITLYHVVEKLLPLNKKVY